MEISSLVFWLATEVLRCGRRLEKLGEDQISTLHPRLLPNRGGNVEPKSWKKHGEIYITQQNSPS